ncbi:unnamed protein product [Tetraodon nigroviridis]|uniref:(spotted green pufferfish) hypothetical protein n=1 Tax=Tetraodon nigroviridis TaxID=99883 RepID=Q4RNW7_TETNG|nr:unnamed protein product [Tetraodon nigroviridis]
MPTAWYGGLGPLCLLSLHPLPTRPEVGNQTNYGCI